MSIFWIFWGTDVIVAVIALVFFVIGLNDGSVSGKRTPNKTTFQNRRSNDL